MSINHEPPFFLLPQQAPACRPASLDDAIWGGAASNLWEMARLGLPVPETLVLGPWQPQAPESGPPPLADWGVPALEKLTGRRLGDPSQPLLVAVRSGAPVPGLPESVLNVGLCDRTVGGLLRQTGNPRRVWDAYRRLVAALGEAVSGEPGEGFTQALQAMADGRDEHELDFAEQRRLCQTNLQIYQRHTGQPFPQDPREQLQVAVQAIFRAWHAPRAVAHRRWHGHQEPLGMVIVVQRMIWTDTGWRTGKDVAFTRNPHSGEPGLWLDDPGVAEHREGMTGRRLAPHATPSRAPSAEVWHTLQAVAHTLERHFRDMQEIDFTVEAGTLHLLQTRIGSRSPQATARIALDMWREGLIDTPTALARTAHLRPQDLHNTLLERLADLRARAANGTHERTLPQQH